MWNDISKRVGRIIAWGLVLACLLVGVQLLVGFVSIRRFHHGLACVYALVLVIALACALWHLFIHDRLMHRRRHAPELPEHLEEAAFGRLRDYARYLKAFMEDLAHNEHLSSEKRQALVKMADSVADALASHPLRDDLIREINRSEQDTITPALAELEHTAHDVVRQHVRDLMLDVTLSPHHTFEGIIVLARTVHMVLGIVHVFGKRPGGQAGRRLLLDMGRLAFSMNMQETRRDLAEALYANLPFAGRAADDLAEGLGQGMMAATIGQAAIGQYKSIRLRKSAASPGVPALQARGTWETTRDVFVHDVLPRLKPRLQRAIHATQTEEHGFWRRLVQSIDAAAQHLFSSSQNV